MNLNLENPRHLTKRNTQQLCTWPSCITILVENGRGIAQGAAVALHHLHPEAFASEIRDAAVGRLVKQPAKSLYISSCPAHFKHSACLASVSADLSDFFLLFVGLWSLGIRNGQIDQELTVASQLLRFFFTEANKNHRRTCPLKRIVRHCHLSDMQWPRCRLHIFKTTQDWSNWKKSTSLSFRRSFCISCDANSNAKGLRWTAARTIWQPFLDQVERKNIMSNNCGCFFL